MILHFHEPPPVQRAGGLDAAISGLRGALESAGHRVIVNPPAGAERPDAVHFHGMWQPQFAAAARRIRAEGVPFVVSPHGMLEPWAWRHKWWKKQPYWHLVEKRWARRAACVLATAETEAKRLRRFFPATRIAALPLGLTGDQRPDYTGARAKLGWREDETVLLFLSRIHEKKGLDLLLAALVGIAPDGTRLVIVGPDEQPAYAERCRAFAAANAARLPRVEWVGAVWGRERWAYLQGADLFCLPTHSENFGLVVLEACQAGTPALTTTQTPWAEVLGDGRGFIAEPEAGAIRGQLRAFFAGLKRAEAQRAELSQWAWREYDWANLAPRYAELYASL